MMEQYHETLRDADAVRRRMDDLAAERRYALREAEAAEQDQRAAAEQADLSTQATSIISLCCDTVRNGVRDAITATVSPVLQAVYGDHIKFDVNFRFLRGKPSAEMEYRDERTGFHGSYKSGKPRSGGLMSLTSILSLIACVCQVAEKPLIWLDERVSPLGTRNTILSHALSYIAKSLGITIVVITHTDYFDEHADVTYYVERGGDDGSSQVERQG